jgi:hypothetical protein
MAAGSTYTPIATNTLTSNQPSVTFSSITSSYTDLVLVLNTGATGAIAAFMQFNGDTGSNYSFVQMWGNNGSTAYSETVPSTSWIDLQSIGTTVRHTNICNIMSYSQTNKQKGIISRSFDSNNNRWYQSIGTWRNTAAINQIYVYASSGSFITGSSFTLYGIKAA